MIIRNVLNLGILRCAANAVEHHDDGADEIVIISRTADKQLQGHLTSFYNVIR